MFVDYAADLIISMFCSIFVIFHFLSFCTTYFAGVYPELRFQTLFFYLFICTLIALPLHCFYTPILHNCIQSCETLTAHSRRNHTFKSNSKIFIYFFYCSKVWGWEVFLNVIEIIILCLFIRSVLCSFIGCIYLMKNTVTTVII